MAVDGSLAGAPNHFLGGSPPPRMPVQWVTISCRMNTRCSVLQAVLKPVRDRPQVPAFGPLRQGLGVIRTDRNHPLRDAGSADTLLAAVGSADGSDALPRCIEPSGTLQEFDLTSSCSFTRSDNVEPKAQPVS